MAVLQMLLHWLESQEKLFKERCGLENGVSNSSSDLPPLQPDEGLLDTLADISSSLASEFMLLVFLFLFM